MDVSRALLGSVPLRRETYMELPGGAEEENIAFEPSKPQYGMSTDCKDSCETIRDFVSDERWQVTSMDKSVFFWTQQGLTMGIWVWGGFRDPSQTNLDEVILKENGNFETGEKEKF